MWVAAIEYEYGLNTVLVDHTRQLEEEDGVDVQADEELRDMIELHHFVVEDGAHVILLVHLLVHAHHIL